MKRMTGPVPAALVAGCLLAAALGAPAVRSAADPVPNPIEEARTLLAAADTTGALAALEAEIAGVRPAFAERLLAARLLLAVGRIDEAAAHAERVIALRPDSPGARHVQGLVALAAADTARALDLWEGCLESQTRGGGR